MSDNVQITVPEYVKKVFESYAKKKGITNAEAAERVTGVAVSRLNALKRHAEKKAAESSKPAKKVAKKAKAKGPLARKTKGAKATEVTA